MIEAILTQSLLGGLGSKLRKGRLVHGGSDQVGIVHGSLCPVGGSGLGGDSGDGFLQHGSEAGVIITGGAFQLTVLGNDVPAAAGLHLANGHNSGVSGADLTADDALQVLNDGAGDNHCVNALVGGGAVAAAAMDVHGVHISGCHAGAGFQGNLTGLHIGPDMNAEAGIHAVHGALLDHGFGAQGHLFRRLESQLDGAAKLVLMVVQNAGGGEHGGGVAVMAAGMHHAGILAGVGSAGLLLNGQGVHITAQQDGLAGLGALDGGQHAGLQAAGTPLDPILIQLGLDGLAGLILLGAYLGMGVEVAAHLNKIIVIGSSNLIDIHFLSIS